MTKKETKKKLYIGYSNNTKIYVWSSNIQSAFGLMKARAMKIAGKYQFTQISMMEDGKIIKLLSGKNITTVSGLNL